ncbi:MAG: hypothetical protein K2H43_01500 [Clostridia bacterium]|nr:hypothetical protein [Clostridia bacterium]
MKKVFFSLIVLGALLPALTACGGYDYTAHISEAREDIFCAETEEFSLTLFCTSREYPYASDGVACPVSKIAEISLQPKERELGGYEIYVVGEKEWGGETSFRNTHGDYYYSQGVEAFPQTSVTMRVVWDGGEREVTATSIKNENTLTVNEALGYAVKAEQDTISRMKRNGKFFGEFYVRLLRRNINYYYVGIVDGEGKTLSLLLNSETGEVLARREG